MPAYNQQRSVVQTANDGEILLTSLSLGCFCISSLCSDAQFWGAELFLSPLLLSQGGLLNNYIPYSRWEGQA